MSGITNDFAGANNYHGDPGAECRQFRDLGVDGIFTDFADAGARALKTPPPPGPH